MKNGMKWMGMLMMVVLMGCASGPSVIETAEVRGELIHPPPKDKAMILFMRSSGMARAVDFSVWDQDKLIGILKARSYFAYTCDPGEHFFVGIGENNAGLRANLEGGKKYYAGVTIGMGRWKARMGFKPVTTGSEYWDVVEEWERSLYYLDFSQETLNQYEAKYQSRIHKILDFFENDPTADQYIVHISPEDGR